jgi:hypothetical protein
VNVVGEKKSGFFGDRFEADEWNWAQPSAKRDR